MINDRDKFIIFLILRFLDCRSCYKLTFGIFSIANRYIIIRVNFLLLRVFNSILILKFHFWIFTIKLGFDLWIFDYYSKYDIKKNITTILFNWNFYARYTVSEIIPLFVTKSWLYSFIARPLLVYANINPTNRT